MTRTTDCNSPYNKMAIKCLHEALCFVSSSCLINTKVLQNNHLLSDDKRLLQRNQTKLNNNLN